MSSVFFIYFGGSEHDVSHKVEIGRIDNIKKSLKIPNG
jgi:hypothetical protein